LTEQTRDVDGGPRQGQRDEPRACARETLEERLALPQAFLSRTDLAALGLPRRAVDAVFREAARRDGVIYLPGYSRPLIRVEIYHAVVADSTYGNDRVWPSGGRPSLL